MKIEKYHRQGGSRPGAPNGDLPTQWGRYTSPYITADESQNKHRQPGPPLMLRGRHRQRMQPRPVGVRSMVQAYPPSNVPIGFTYAGGSLSGNIFAESPYLDDMAETPAYGAVGNYEMGDPGAPDAVQANLGYTYAGPAALAAKVKAFFSRPLVLAILLGVGGFILYKLFMQPALAQSNPESSRHSWGRYSRSRRRRTRKPARNSALSAQAKKRERNPDGTFKKVK